jgi:hypothetical protein
VTTLTTSGLPPCAAPYARVDLRPSPLWVWAWISWLLVCAAVVQAAVGLPWVVRAGVVLGFGVVGAVWVRRTVLLRGPRALRAVEWTALGRFSVRLGESRRCLPAEPAPGCQRYGPKLWILRFDTAEGAVQAIVDPSRLDPGAVRRLGRQLNVSGRGELLTSRPKV